MSLRTVTLISGLLILLFSGAVFLANYLWFHFTGNNYIPAGALEAGICLFSIYSSIRFVFKKNHYLCRMIQYIFLLYLAMGVIAIFTNAVQLTPFAPIDKQILDFERFIHIDMTKIIAWTAGHRWLQYILVQIYDSLPYQMVIFPLALALSGKFARLDEYFFLLLSSALTGFTFYFFLPTTAPASIISSPFFSQEQYATGLKFMEIHHYQLPSTTEGGLIALPSFHVIWAWFCIYIVRCWTFVFALILPVNILLMISCVLLGWHYPVDIAGALLVILISHAFANKFGRLGLPTAFSPPLPAGIHESDCTALEPADKPKKGLV